MQIADRVSLWGGKKSPLPPGARWVEYLESTSTQWIDTGVYYPALANMTFTIRFRPVNLIISNNAIFGMNNSGSRGIGVLFTLLQNRGVVALQGEARSSVYTGKTEIKDYEAQLTNAGLTLDGEIWESSRTSVGRHGNIFLFAGNSVTLDGVSTAQPRAVRVYSFSITRGDTGEVLRDLRPIAIGTTGYMLDLVSGEHLPYGNKGTGEFIVGPDAPAMTGGGISAYA